MSSSNLIEFHKVEVKYKLVKVWKIYIAVHDEFIISFMRWITHLYKLYLIKILHI